VFAVIHDQGGTNHEGPRPGHWRHQVGEPAQPERGAGGDGSVERGRPLVLVGVEARERALERDEAGPRYDGSSGVDHLGAGAADEDVASGRDVDAELERVVPGVEAVATAGGAYECDSGQVHGSLRAARERWRSYTVGRPQLELQVVRERPTAPM
jgi:hypothetical protein